MSIDTVGLILPKEQWLYDFDWNFTNGGYEWKASVIVVVA